VYGLTQERQSLMNSHRQSRWFDNQITAIG
jgi:hypothetical protein